MSRDITIDRSEKQKLIIELAAKGMTVSEIAQYTGINYKSVYYYMNREKYKPKKKAAAIPVAYKNPDARPGWNADRKIIRLIRIRATAITLRLPDIAVDALWRTAIGM